MIQICQKGKEKIFDAIFTGKIDAVEISFAVAVKLKYTTSLTNVPFAVMEAELLAELGWNIRDNERNINQGLFSESVMRRLLAKYKSEEWISFCKQLCSGASNKRTGHSAMCPYTGLHKGPC